MMSRLPSGAMELLVALATPTPKGYWGVPVLVWGTPGTGKSTFIESLARPHFPVFTMIASLHEPTDFSGLPVLHEGRTHFVPPQWVDYFEDTAAGAGGVLFLDELTTAPPTVQAALLRLVLERKVGTYALPPTVRIAAAANPPELAASGWELSPPLANRFVHIQWDLASEVYLEALSYGFESPELPRVEERAHAERSVFWRSVVRGFLSRGGALYTEPAEGEYGYATPRSWDFAIALMATCDLLGHAPSWGGASGARGDFGIFTRLMRGAIGSGASTAFLKYLHELRIPDPMEVLEGRASVDPRLREDELHTLFTSMAGILIHRWKQEQVSAWLQSASVQFFRVVEQVASNSKADSAYIAIRQLVNTCLPAVAQSNGELQQLVRRLGSRYEGLIELLDPKR